MSRGWNGPCASGWCAEALEENTHAGPVLTVYIRLPVHFLLQNQEGGGGHGTRRNQHSPSTPTTGLRERRNDTSMSTGRSGGQNAATRRNMRRKERVTVQGPVKKQQPDGMSHQGGGGGSA